MRQPRPIPAAATTTAAASTAISRRRMLGLTTAAGAALPLLSACGSAELQPLPKPPENAAYPLAKAEEFFKSLEWPTTDVAEPTGPTTVTLAITASEDAEIRHQQFAYFFRELHPTIEIKREVTSFGDYLTKYLTSAAGGSLPDLMYCHYSWAQNLIKNGVLAPIDSYIAKTPEFKLDDFSEQAYSYWVRDGEHFGIPSDSAPKMLFYNKEIFDRAGIEPPGESWTWDHLYRVAAELTSGSGVNKVYGYTAMPQMKADLTPVHLLPYGGRFLSEDERSVQVQEQPAYDALAPWVELQVKHQAVPSLAEMQALEDADPFRTNHAAMSVNGLWIVPALQRLQGKDKFDWAVTHVPKGPAGRFSPLVGSAYGITSKARNPEAAWIVLNALMSPAGQRYFNLTPPARLSTFEQNLADLQLPKEIAEVGKAAITDYAGSDGVLRGVGTKKVEDTAKVTWDEVRAGAMPLADGLAKINTELTPILQEAG
ncbi:ABC transporter substrate-binding protein [Microlunatus speluncae]|uniref:ABC transporter substrate-binding protein n=1 Tax=Microlunatus speluncae TaxID=2594267 RepID=UPI00126629C7|nr:sugar ABC transporter substrate-binding protein [Microlunatus speluncae]